MHSSVSIVDPKPATFLIHVLVSNQSTSMSIAQFELTVDDRQIFDREMAVDTQHSWEQVTIPLTRGNHSLVVREVKTQIYKSQVLNIDRELWITVTLHSSPAQLELTVFDHAIALM